MSLRREGVLNTTQASLLYSYQFRVNRKFSIRAGFQGTFVQKSLDVSNLRFGDILFFVGYVLPNSLSPQTTCCNALLPTVTGLPEPQADHAVRMAKFAHNCQIKMRELMAELKHSFGEDTEGNLTQIACSQQIVDRSELIETELGHKISVYLKDTELFANPIPGVYILTEDFPRELY